jgi:enoyl-CoA hydratase/carnithine racemase
MMMFDQIDAQKALDYGLVNEVVPRDKLYERAMEIAPIHRDQTANNASTHV